jgi:hypothetical protein
MREAGTSDWISVAGKRVQGINGYSTAFVALTYKPRLRRL